MKLSRPLVAIAVSIGLTSGFAPAEDKSVNPKIQEMMGQVSEARIKAILEKLESFGTRNTMSNADDPVRGVGAARTWILNEMKSYNPKLQVQFEKFRVKKQGQRIFKDVDLYNVVAYLPGKKMPETVVVVSAHYDSLNLGTRPAGAAAGPGTEASGGAGAGAPGNTAATMTLADFEKNAELPAPGVCDDGSGTAAVMELARVMSQYEFDKTLAFVTFAGEEQGLIGSSLQAVKAKKENQVIEAVLNNDIIGTDVAGNGRMGNGVVSVYSDESMDSVSQQLSRYVREIGERYLPAMKVNTVFMGDRLSRGGRPHAISVGGIRRGAHLHAERDLCQPAPRHGPAGQHVGAVYGEGGEGKPGGSGESGNCAKGADCDARTAHGRRTAGRRYGDGRSGHGWGRASSYTDDLARRRLRCSAALARGGSG